MVVTPFYTVTTDATTHITTYTPNTNVPSVQEVRDRWCFGLPLTKDNGEPMTDDYLYDFLLEKIAEVERKLGVHLKPTIIVCNPDERGLVKGTDYDREEPAYDYDVKAWLQWGFLQLRERPVQRIDGLRLVLPNGQTIVDFYSSDSRRKWIKLYKDNGQIHLVPYAGDPTLFAMLGGSASGYPFVTGTINSNMPQMIEVDYVAGHNLWEIPNDIRNVIGKLTAIDILGIAGDAVMAGISSQSTSIDGLSESFSTSASATSGTYSSHIKQMQDEVNDFFDPRKGGARTSERGITMIGL